MKYVGPTRRSRVVSLRIMGSRIRERRKYRRMTQEKLGRKLMVGRSSVCWWEKGNRMPTLETLIHLANALRCSTDYLLGRSDYPDLY